MNASKVYSAVAFFCFGGGGAVLAAIWFDGKHALAVGIVCGAVLVGWTIGTIVPNRLLPRHPTVAVWCIELWILLPGAAAAAAAAAIVIIAVALSVPDSAPVQQKQVFSAYSVALTALVTTLFLKAFENADSDVIGEHVRSIFEGKYKTPGPHFASESEGEQWVYNATMGGLDGWSVEARHKRAGEIQKRLNQLIA